MGPRRACWPRARATSPASTRPPRPWRRPSSISPSPGPWPIPSSRRTRARRPPSRPSRARGPLISCCSSTPTTPSERPRRWCSLAPRLAKDGIRVRGVRIDSGDLAAHARKVRRILDAGGLAEAIIFASGGLDETILARHAREAAPIDGYGIGTALTTSSDAPALDCAYKLQEYAGLARRKHSEGKATWPGRKQVYRQTAEDGAMAGDILTLVGDAQPGEPLLRPAMRGGKRVPGLPTLARRAPPRRGRIGPPAQRTQRAPPLELSRHRCTGAQDARGRGRSPHRGGAAAAAVTHAPSAAMSRSVGSSHPEITSLRAQRTPADAGAARLARDPFWIASAPFGHLAMTSVFLMSRISEPGHSCTWNFPLPSRLSPARAMLILLALAQNRACQRSNLPSRNARPRRARKIEPLGQTIFGLFPLSIVPPKCSIPALPKWKGK